MTLAGPAAARGEAGSRPGGWQRFRLTLDVAPGWHLQANPASEPYLVPTTLAANAANTANAANAALAADAAELRGVAYPPADEMRVAFSQRPLAVYRGHVELTGEIRLPAGHPAGGAGAALLRLTYQLCDHDRCLPPVSQAVRVP